MSNNAQLMSTAPSYVVRDTCPPSVSGKSSGQKQNTFIMDLVNPEQRRGHVGWRVPAAATTHLHLQ